LAQLSTEGPLSFSGSPNPVGAFAAASFAVAEVWKTLLFPHSHLFPGIPICPISGTFSFSTFDYRHDANGLNPDLFGLVDLDRTTIVGLGAGGAATAYTLACLPYVRADLALVEPDELVDTNLNRFVCGNADDVEAARKKVGIVGDLFSSHPQVRVRTFPNPFDTARAHLEVEDYRRVVAAVHSRAARQSIQMETPEVLWDAGATDAGEFFVWRLAFGETPCLACRFARSKDDPEWNKARQLEKLLGLSSDIWHRKVRDNEAFTKAEIQSMQRKMTITDAEFRFPTPDERFGDWEAEQCGKLRLPNPDDEIPIPFAPVLAGVLIAGEVIKQASFPQAALSGYYWNTLIGRFLSVNQPRRPKPKRDCPICASHVFVSQYRRRWGGNTHSR
jgi:molybdopterin/thiamine biosynthesis adenylyltransferase